MKITIECLADFLREIEREHANIHDDTIRVREISTDVNEIVQEISYVVTAVIADDDGSGFLLRYAEDCGVDQPDMPHGTTKRSEGIDLISEVCDKLNLHIRPGEIEL